MRHRNYWTLYGASSKRLIGVEVIEAAVENARKNSQINGIENAEFICGDAASAAEVLEKQGLRPNVIVIDLLAKDAISH